MLDGLLLLLLATATASIAYSALKSIRGTGLGYVFAWAVSGAVGLLLRGAPGIVAPEVP